MIKFLEKNYFPSIRKKIRELALLSVISEDRDNIKIILTSFKPLFFGVCYEILDIINNGEIVRKNKGLAKKNIMDPLEIKLLCRESLKTLESKDINDANAKLLIGDLLEFIKETLNFQKDKGEIINSPKKKELEADILDILEEENE